MAREEPVIMIGEKVKATMREFKQRNQRQVRMKAVLRVTSG